MESKIKKNVKILLIILVSMIIIVFFNFLRNLFIINSLYNKTLEYKDSNNYHMVWSTYSNEDISIFDIYVKGNIAKRINTYYNYNYFINNDENPSKAIMYWDKDENLYYQYFYANNIINSGKYPGGDDFIMEPQNFNGIELIKENTLYFLRTCLNTIIISSECNGNIAYKFLPVFKIQNTVYFSKENGYLLRTESVGYSYDNKTIDANYDVIYEFDNVKDEDVAKPSMDGFTIQEIN